MEMLHLEAFHTTFYMALCAAVLSGYIGYTGKNGAKMITAIQTNEGVKLRRIEVPPNSTPTENIPLSAAQSRIRSLCRQADVKRVTVALGRINGALTLSGEERNELALALALLDARIDPAKA